MDKALTWVCDRFIEASTWSGLGLAVVAASVVPAPWCYPVAVFGCIAVILKGGDGAGK